MVESLSVWAKSIILAVVVVSILEMLLPNNKTKKYVKMVMGVFILYNIISPIIKDKSSLSFAEIDLKEYSSTAINTVEVNQESMDKRLEELYIQEIEKDITKKVEKQGFVVKSCKVKAKISDNERETGIKKIYLRVEKNTAKEQDENAQNDEQIENKIISEIQKVKKIDTRISKESKSDESTKLEKTDIQNLKKLLIQEYEVNEKCLEIN